MMKYALEIQSWNLIGGIDSIRCGANKTHKHSTTHGHTHTSAHAHTHTQKTDIELINMKGE